ncbi:insect toxin mu-NPTX-Nc1a-like [Diorhabda carinulata]|uniref:insect toxin mu-NPTX-Nc1a-like n=1 Tax=Diorhabda carinulata TaxID=1163345 RepID=UPI0025A2BF28|nr:insect toxin mu-NPTX-Nc1a-like [Diorhabda carinulata]
MKYQLLTVLVILLTSQVICFNCDPPYCQGIQCGVPKCPKGTELRSNPCVCCPACYVIKGEGEDCAETDTLCDRNLYCNENNRCVKS